MLSLPRHVSIAHLDCELWEDRAGSVLVTVMSLVPRTGQGTDEGEVKNE